MLQPSSSPRGPTLLARTLLVLCALAACGDGSSNGRVGSADAADRGSSGAGSSATVSDRVLGRVPDFRLTNQDGQPYGSDELSGKLWVATFIFTSCSATCPRQTTRFSELQEHLASDEARGAVRQVSITVDPARDTAAILREYGAAAGADFERWNFLTGDHDTLFELCKTGFLLPVFDASEKTSGVIAHSQMAILVDQEGRIRGYYDALDDAAYRSLKQDIGIVLQEQSG
jgi:protein SCO1/2